MATPRSRIFSWTFSILVACAILSASSDHASAQWGIIGRGYGFGAYPAWGYNIGVPGYYSDFRAQSYYAAPWIGGYESPWYGPGGFAGGLGYSPAGAGRYPWIWNRHAGFVTRGFVAATSPASIKVQKNPFYKSGETSPSDNVPKTTSAESKNGLIKIVSNPHVLKQ